MNIYLITEDGQTFCIGAETMQEAVDTCLDRHMEEYKELGSLPKDKIDLDYETKIYHDEVLESCQLIGELKN